LRLARTATLAGSHTLTTHLHRGRFPSAARSHNP
jgi:hypothetical protein